jgi:hypothetical protein
MYEELGLDGIVDKNIGRLVHRPQHNLSGERDLASGPETPTSLPPGAPRPCKVACASCGSLKNPALISALHGAQVQRMQPSQLLHPKKKQQHDCHVKQFAMHLTIA